MASFSDGVTININGTPATISAAEQQADHAVINYTISPAVQAGDIVTWEYSAAAGHIVAETGGAALESISGAEVTNNVAPAYDPAPLWALEADTLALGAVTTWADQSGHGYDFTRGAGSNGLTVMADAGGKKFVRFNGVDDWMLGPDFADNLNSFTIVMVFSANWNTGVNNVPISKCLRTYGVPLSVGWYIEYEADLYIEMDTGDPTLNSNNQESFSNDVKMIMIFNVVDVFQKQVAVYKNGVLVNDAPTTSGTVTNYSTTEPVRLGTDGTGGENGFDHSDRYAYRIYTPALSSGQVSSVTQEIANRYGVTL